MLRRIDTSGATESRPTAFAIMRRELEDGTSVVSVDGELDLASSPRLKWMLVECLEAGCKRLVIDLSHVAFLDSTALGVLVAISRRLDEGQLAIVCARETLVAIFELSGTARVFAIHPTLDDALAYVRGQLAQAG